MLLSDNFERIEPILFDFFFWPLEKQFHYNLLLNTDTRTEGFELTHTIISFEFQRQIFLKICRTKSTRIEFTFTFNLLQKQANCTDSFRSLMAWKSVHHSTISQVCIYLERFLVFYTSNAMLHSPNIIRISQSIFDAIDAQRMLYEMFLNAAQEFTNNNNNPSNCIDCETELINS